MKLLNGMAQVRQLSARKQRRFERFYRAQTRYRLLPLFADLSLFITIVGTLLHILNLARGPEGIHFLTYVYTGILVALALLHRFTRLRRTSPLIVYLVFSQMALFGYLGYIGAAGGVLPIFGLYFFLSSVGLLTLSVRHTLAILAINAVLLVLATYLAVEASQVMDEVVAVLSNWFVVMCTLIAPLSAFFFRRFFRNILALQFLLRDRNKLLSETLRSLQVTEDKLIQQQKHQALSHMAKGLLHEIMNPVNCSTQALQFAKSINGDRDVGEALDDAVLNQERIASIVSDLIEFSRPQPDHAPERADLLELVSTAVRFCRNDLRGIEVRVRVPAGTPVLCYPSAMIQVFVNLLLNAVSALGNREGARVVEIECEPGAHRLDIRLRDNGRGIPAPEIKRLTEPFYSTKEAPDSLGLGLSICQTIMHHHHGQMTIHSELGQWTEVTLSLPAEPIGARADTALSG